MKLFLKGQRCYSEKCAIEKRNFVPGEHGRMTRRRSQIIGYGMQLREKQKLKRIYGVMERQFRNYFELAARREGITGELLLQYLERRLDNVVYRLGFASSRSQARQLVRHNHLLVNGRRVNIPSYLVSQGDLIQLKPATRKNVFVQSSLENVVGRGVPDWLQLEAAEFRGHVLDVPRREHLTLPIEEQLIVELYSK